MSNEENIINFDEFIKVDLRVAKIIEAKDVEEADKLEIRVILVQRKEPFFRHRDTMIPLRVGKMTLWLPI